LIFKECVKAIHNFGTAVKALASTVHGTGSSTQALDGFRAERTGSCVTDFSGSDVFAVAENLTKEWVSFDSCTIAKWSNLRFA